MSTDLGHGPANAELVPAHPQPGTPPPDEPIKIITADVSSHPWTQAPPRRPVFPAWLRHKDQRRSAASWAVRHAGHVAAFHTVRAPLYLTVHAARSPVGFGRVLHAVWHWCFDREGHELRVHAVESRDAKAYATLARIRRDRVRHRLAVIVAAGIAGSILLGTLTAIVPQVRWYLLGCAVLLLGYAGRPLGRPLVQPAVVSARAERLTQDIIVRALGSLSLSGIDRVLREGREIVFVSPVVRDGPGWRVEIDLPYGTTVSEVVERRDKLASGLRRPLGCVWPEPASEEHTGRLVLYVADVPLSKARQAPWPLTRAGKADLFAPIPFGQDQRGKPVTLTLMFANLLIGAIPRMGKTVAMLVVLLACALDARCEIRCWELKGTGDLDAMRKVAHRYGSGADVATIEACLADLREMHRELERRAKVISGLPADLCPNRKVTPELAGKKSLRLHPLVLAISECQEIFSSKDYGGEAGELATAVIKRGPALGIMLILDTQKPDAKSLPTSVSSNVGMRFCLKVMDQPANDMVLGTSARKRGIDSTLFALSDKGVGYAVGLADDPQVVRTYPVDGPLAETVCARARLLREAAGTITGYAAGEQPETGQQVSLLADVAAVMPEPKAHLATIAARLGELRPGVYGGWDERAAGAALRAQGVIVGQVWADGANRNGVDREAVLAAIAGGSDA
ncbi:MAG TPA: cell division protein FtsK [Streptosporangiaceae bacterium]|jgi:S-DNA-T family DNA segregation ATPase FtsK/SpoIIIE